jgi:hypothetical protein
MSKGLRRAAPTNYFIKPQRNARQQKAASLFSADGYEFCQMMAHRIIHPVQGCIVSPILLNRTSEFIG